MNINIRQATSKDKDILFDLSVLLDTYNQKVCDTGEEFFWRGWEEDYKKEIDADLNNKYIKIYLAETDDAQIAGYVQINLCECCGNFLIDQLYVKDEYRGQNIGQQLMQFAEQEGQKVASSSSLEVYKSNTSAINFYNKLGYKEDGLILRKEF